MTPGATGFIFIADAMGEALLRLAYVIWQTLMDTCYDTLQESPFDFGKHGENGATLLSDVLDVSQNIIIAVATALLITVWLVGVLREGGNMLADRAHPYAFLTHLLRLILCEGFIAGFFYVADFIFSLFTVATQSVLNSSNVGILDPNSAEALTELTSNMPSDSFEAGLTICSAMLGIPVISTDGLFIDILALLYLITVTVCAFVIFIKIYGRYFRIVASIAVAPIGISLFGSAHTEQNGRKYIFYLMKLGAEGLIIALDLLIFNLAMDSGANLTPQMFKAIADAITFSPESALVIGYMITQIFLCVLLMTLISATEKMCEQLL